MSGTPTTWSAARSGTDTLHPVRSERFGERDPLHLADFRHHPAVRGVLAATTREVTEARLAPSSAARRLLTLFEPTPR